MISKIKEKDKNHPSLVKTKQRMKLKCLRLALKNSKSKKIILSNLENFFKINKKHSQKTQLFRK
jgi:hypothetical protein